MSQSIILSTPKTGSRTRPLYNAKRRHVPEPVRSVLLTASGEPIGKKEMLPVKHESCATPRPNAHTRTYLKRDWWEK